MAGYSKRSLADKPGIKAVYSVLVGALRSGVSLHSGLQSPWVSWPKQASGIETRS